MINITAFEYITAGGFIGKAIPTHLGNQARLMIARVVAHLKAMAGLEVQVVAADERFHRFFEKLGVAKVASPANLLPNKGGLFLPIAPEWALEEVVAKAGAMECLASSPDALKVACSKAASARLFPILPATGYYALKPVYGCGCEGVYRLNTRPPPQPGKLCQPWLNGDYLSVLGLFKQGEGRVLQISRQRLAISPTGKVELKGLVCGIKQAGFGKLVGWVAKLLGGLYGFCGIDVVRFNGKLYPIEINPRITTAYLGLDNNPLEWLLELRNRDLRRSYPSPTKKLIVL